MVELLVPGDERTPSRPNGPTTSTRSRIRRSTSYLVNPLV